MVRGVAAPNDAARTDEGHQGGQGALVDVEADGALAGEVLRWATRHVGAEPAEGFRLRVQPSKPEGHPATRGPQEQEAQPGMAFQGSAGDQLGAGEHGLERVRRGMEDERVAGVLRPEGRHTDGAPWWMPIGTLSSSAASHTTS